jgi:diaminopimelate decarboxylase
MDRAILLDIASSVGTPAYIYNLDTVRGQCRQLRAALSTGALDPPPLLLYAMKANFSRPVLEVCVSELDGLECVSLGEVLLARRLGAQRILYTNNNASHAELAAVLELARDAGGGRLWINCDSIQRLGELPSGSEAFLRINGPVGAGHHAHVVTCGPNSKFGVPHEDLTMALTLAKERGVRIIGLHQHIGSGIRDPAS